MVIKCYHDPRKAMRLLCLQVLWRRQSNSQNDIVEVAVAVFAKSFENTEVQKF
jgi:hypothetical protein